MPGLKRTLTTFVVCFVVCFVSTLVLRLGRSNTSVNHPERSVMLSSSGDSNGWKSALDSLQTEPGYLVTEPVTERNPRQIRARDPKLKKEFDYLIYDLGKDIELKLVKIEAKGKSFAIGSPTTEKGRFSFEGQARVAFTNDFYLGVFEVTRKQFARFVDATGYVTSAERTPERTRSWRRPGIPQSENDPAVFVSWRDAKKFCEWLSKSASARVGGKSMQIRLPGEAEWEFACRSGSKTRFYFGDDEEDLAKYENVRDAMFREKNNQTGGIKASDGYPYTSPVGSFKPNNSGLYDMLGNANEWVEDFFGPYEKLPVGNSQIQKTRQDIDARVQRGGSWYDSGSGCRSASREAVNERDCAISLGFRIAVVIE
jgi:formylglycine-generating enzyme required for sulfatase activity